MGKSRKILLVTTYTLLFTLLLFVWKEIFFPDTYYQEQYLEPTLSWHWHSHSFPAGEEEFASFTGTTQDDVDAAIKKLIYESYSQKYSRAQKRKVSLRYIPTKLRESIEYSYVPIVEVFLYKKDILSHIQNLWVYLYRNSHETRGRMKWWNIHMYGVEKLTDSEFLSVLIHEFAHYYDIYSLPGNAFWDISSKFYGISWDSVTTIAPWSVQADFVSGYAMTNQYEDFAETYLYYVLHNEDFRKKTQGSLRLKQKYNFMWDYVFQKNQFTWQDYSTELIENYYWDITKIPVDVKNFLQYLQDDI